MAAMLLIAGGCSATEPSRFYTLESIAKPPVADAPSATAGATIVVGPITLPKYLDRPQVVTRPEPFVASIAEFDRWIEPLDEMVPRVIAENLAALLQTDQVLISPRQRPAAPAFQVDITVLRFDIDQENRAVLLARWVVVNRADNQVTASSRTSLVTPATGSSFEARVQALSQTLALLSQEIAEQLRRVSA